MLLQLLIWVEGLATGIRDSSKSAFIWKGYCLASHNSKPITSFHVRFAPPVIHNQSPLCCALKLAT
jgi:hypothetical protein